MKIAIVVAMQKELDLLLPHISDIVKSEKGRFIVYHGQMAGCEIIAMQSGIGKVNSALALQCMLNDFAPDLVINTGVAGGTGRAGILDVVVGSRVAYHDVWCGWEPSGTGIWLSAVLRATMRLARYTRS